MTNTPKHTPTPWHIDGFNITSGISLKSGRQYYKVFDCGFEGVDFDCQKANAKLIITAVNNHYQLVEALDIIQAAAKSFLNCPEKSSLKFDLVKAVGNAVRTLSAVKDGETANSEVKD